MGTTRLTYNQGSFGTIDYADAAAGVVLVDPREGSAAQEIVDQITRAAPNGHFFFPRSGTEALSNSGRRFIALSREALQASAEAVNKHLEVSQKDAWALSLPDFHVGGFGVQVRAHEAHIPFFRGPGNDRKWQASEYVAFIAHTGSTLGSLVPAQVHDVVAAKLTAPPSIRAIVVGGGACPPDLYHAARALGWPLLPSYGLSEFASQVATAPLRSLAEYALPQFLPILPHVEVTSDSSQLLLIRGRSSFSGYVELRPSGPTFLAFDGQWFRTADRGAIKDSCLEVFGRADDIVKVGGENVSLSHLDSLVERYLREAGGAGKDAAVFAETDERLGHVIALAATDRETAETIARRLGEEVLAFAAPRKICVVPEIPRTSLGKVRRRQVRELADEITAVTNGTLRRG